MQGVLHGFQENYCGGGVWLLTLLLAVSTILGYATITPANVKAADNTWSLYYWTGDEIKPANTTLKFTGLGDNNSTDELMGIAADGKTYVIRTDSTDKDYIDIIQVTDGNSADFHACRSDGIAIVGHSGCGGASVGDDRLSVDTEGRAWFAGFREGSDGMTIYSEGPTQVQGNDKMEYATVVRKGNENALFLARPRVQQPQTVINQMPTTGAPTGLASIGLMSTGIGLVGVMLVLMRRRD